MAPLAFVCFTCTRDAALLHPHYEAIARALPAAPVYYVYEPEDGAQAQVPAGSCKVLAGFPHNGNLLGLNCHLGMLKTMQAIARRHPGACIVKIDSDVVLLNADFFASLGREHDMVGVAPSKVYYCKGTCYGMTAALITRVISYLSGDYIDLSDRLEDSTISMAAAIVADANRVKIHNCKVRGKNEFLYSIFHKQFLEMPSLLHQVRGFFDCGDPLYTSAYPDTVAAKAKAMQFILQHLRK